MCRQILFRLRADDIHHGRMSEPNTRNQDHTSWVLVVRVLALDIPGLAAFHGLTPLMPSTITGPNPLCIIIVPASHTLFKQRSEMAHQAGEVQRSAICWQ